MELTTIIKLLVPLARFIDRRHKTKYLVEILDLKSAIYEEENKKSQGLLVNCARVDNMRMRVEQLMAIFGSSVEAENTSSKK